MGQETGGPTLGEYLASVRMAKKLSLRQVEEATDNEVSNAYLSQLEHGKISQPSPNVLHVLSDVYGVSYENLMELAGYVSVRSKRGENQKHGRIATFAIDNLTPAEEAALLEYLAFLRTRKRTRGAPR